MVKHGEKNGNREKDNLIFLSFTKYKSNGYNCIEIVVKVNILIQAIMKFIIIKYMLFYGNFLSLITKIFHNIFLTLEVFLAMVLIILLNYPYEVA